MFKGKSGIWAVGLGLALLVGCGSNAGMLAERSRTEAAELQDACNRTALKSDETRKADALMASAAKHQKDGKDDLALQAADQAVILYRLALARRDLGENLAAVESLKASLAKDKDQLQTYQQVLEEVKATRKP
jgi:tetratricopeptide (TPR) repeat protein